MTLIPFMKIKRNQWPKKNLLISHSNCYEILSKNQQIAIGESRRL